MDVNLGMQIVNFILGIGAVAGFVLMANKYMNVGRQAAELVVVVAVAMEDGKLSAEEIASIQKEFTDIPAAIRAIKLATTAAK